MRKILSPITACATLFCAGTALSETAQQKCDSARIAAWKVYTSCIDKVLAKEAKGLGFTLAAFTKCRHAYFNKWQSFQGAGYTGSTCAVGLTHRFADNGDSTVTDNLTTLVWEQKDSLDGTQNYADPHDADNWYPWSAGDNNEDGAVFTSFVKDLNVAAFAGVSGWRLPTLPELQSIVLDFVCANSSCTCEADPCIDATFGPTASATAGGYWSATSYLPNPSKAWGVGFLFGDAENPDKTNDYQAYVRAVRGGL